ncbi:unnamed protein product, partial [Tetraodon nigroviridis]
MAPQYAPSLRSRLAPLLLLLQTGFIVVFAFYVDIETHSFNTDLTSNFYAEFQDVHVIVFLGFGFLSTFLIRYGFSGVGFNLLVAATATQWAILLNGLESWYHRGKISLNLRRHVHGLRAHLHRNRLGEDQPCPADRIALLEVTASSSTMALHSLLRVRSAVCANTFLHRAAAQQHHAASHFWPLFGLALTWVLYRRGSEQRFEKEKSGYESGLFSMMGSVFMWMFWPSFNSVLVDERTPERHLEVVCGTYLALAAGAVAAAAVAVLLNPEGKLSLVQLQSCIQAGGVAVGVSASAVHQPWEAMTIGFSAAVLSAVGVQYL